VPPETTVADCEDVLGVVVAVVDPDEAVDPDEDAGVVGVVGVVPAVDPLEEVAVAVVLRAAVVPGISLDTTTPSAAAAAVATMAKAAEVRRTRVTATARCSDGGRPPRPADPAARRRGGVE
jgi:hypothetical protein